VVSVDAIERSQPIRKRETPKNSAKEFFHFGDATTTDCWMTRVYSARYLIQLGF